MRFSLQDIKKQVHRRGSELYVSLHFLRPGELRTEIQRLIAYHEQLIGQPRRQFSLDDARAHIGDYRLAHCLVNTLSAWYYWRQANWSKVLEQIGSEAQRCLEEAGITSPVYLRLALFNYVNEHYQGFLDAAVRTEALQGFAASYQLSVPDLEYLLVLDSDEEELLVREVAQPPTAQDVATLYNQWAFEAALFNASSVHFLIDCNAFENVQEIKAQPAALQPTGTGVGAVIKRLCYLARLLGVYYDLAYEGSVFSTTPLLHLTLYGPQEMTGAPQQYGIRLARLCRMLLGYGVPRRQYAKDARTKLLSSAIVEAEATIHFLQRSYCFVMDNDILALLPPITESNQAHENVEKPAVLAQLPDTSTVFDSSIEQSFAEAFSSLENSQAVDGWHLTREPEPLLLDHGILIPDFVLMRDKRRIYVEILGFWTPAYRERKIQKLQQLQGREDIVLAIPVEARGPFAGIASRFPIVWYDGQLSVTELLSLLRNRYDDFAERLASIKVAEVQKRVENEGLLSERACYELLHCYRRSELALAAEHVIRVSGQSVAFAPGIGLYRIDWMEQLRMSFVEWIGSVGKLPLADVLRQSRERWPTLADCEDAALEAMLGLWPQVRVHRTSIFEAMVELTDNAGAACNAQFIAPNIPNNEAIPNNVPTRKPSREKLTVPKKRVVKEAVQGDLWN
ncbi:MAG: DUF790 family protein [Ktedonobacteraceae bacterium]